MDYFELAQSGIDTIEENIYENLQVFGIAKSIHCSEYHFSRIFHTIVGVTVSEYIRNRRLSLAGQELSALQRKVIDVALKYCYESPEAFAKAFKRFHGISPSECRKTGHFKYFERAFPLVYKMSLSKKEWMGEMNMGNFGSSLKDIIANLDQESKDLYCIIQTGNDKYAVPVLQIAEIYSVNTVYQNSKKQMFSKIRGSHVPILILNDMESFQSLTYTKHNILSSRLLSVDVTQEKIRFGIVINGNPELRICEKLIQKIDSDSLCCSVGIFDKEEIPILSLVKVLERYSDQLPEVFDECKVSSYNGHKEDESNELSGLIDALELKAYDAELLARNASIEASNGKQYHKGTMVVAYELHEHAQEIAKIAQQMRNLLK